MKNIIKIVGIIAILAVVGLMVGCEVAPEDQITITVTDLPANAVGYAIMGVYEDMSKDSVAVSDAPKRISGSSASADMQNSGKGGAFGKDGAYYVVLAIYETAEMNGAPYYSGCTSSKVTLNKGSNTIKADKFYPDIEDNNSFPVPPPEPNQPNQPNQPSEPEDPKAPPVTFFGTYSGTGITSAVIETIVFSETSFSISDNENTPADYLLFTINKWEDVTTGIPSGYTTGYKFTGIITAGRPIVNTGTTSIYGNKTAPGFTQSDIDNKTSCHMYIYTKGEGNNFTFIRTVFTKDSATDSTTIVTSGSGTSETQRVYTKKTQ